MVKPNLGVPTPNEWLDRTLREQGMSNAKLARIIGRERTQVQRWVNGREQIPRHHLAEIAAQLGSVETLNHAIILKECEDFLDALRRRLKEFCRINKCDQEQIESDVLGLLANKTQHEHPAGTNEYFDSLRYNMTHSSFIFRLWIEATYANDFSDLLSPESIRMHVKYPSNHFFGLLLGMEPQNDTIDSNRELALNYLRALAMQQEVDPRHGIATQHAIHMLARFGKEIDQDLIEDQLTNAAKSTDLLQVRLGFAGLIARSNDTDAAERYLRLLSNDNDLALIDLNFEALHYGDADLDSDFQVPREVGSFDKSITTLVRRFEQASAPEPILEIEAFRLLKLLEHYGSNSFVSNPQALARLNNALSNAQGTQGANLSVARRRISEIHLRLKEL